ncbi:hypothetical protein ACOMHN_031826 [Nucella lapillus]
MWRYEFTGIHRKVQLKYQPQGRPHASSSEDDAPRDPSLLLILKWGGELTPAGRIQAENLGKAFRTLYPGGQGQFEAPGLGFLRLHSTFRHDLKIYASDEGRVQMTAAAFTKGLLALEGELTPILVQMVKSANTNGLLDGEGKTSKSQLVVKEKLKSVFNQDQDFKQIDCFKLNPTNTLALTNAMDFVKNPQDMCKHVHQMIREITAKIRALKAELKTRDLPLYNGESWELLIRRWAKLEKDFRLKNGQFEISKIPDIYDCIKYDLQHNQKTLQYDRTNELFMCSKALADIIIPQEYGITVDEKLHIAQNYCSAFLRKIRSDFLQVANPNMEDATTRLDSRYSKGVASPERFVRTRLYFTSESHIHSLLNMLRYGNFFGCGADSQWERALSFLDATAELNYMSQIVFMLFEDPSKDLKSDERYHMELHFSPGAYTSCDEPEPRGMGYRPKHCPQKTEKAEGEKTPHTLMSAFMGPLPPPPGFKRGLRLDTTAAASDLGDISESDMFEQLSTPGASPESLESLTVMEMQWKPLQMFFEEECKKDIKGKSEEEKKRSSIRTRVHDFLKRSTAKLYALFLSFAMESFDILNQELQTDAAKIHVVKRSLEQFYRKLLISFVKPSALSSGTLLAVDFTAKYNMKDSKDILIGTATKQHISGLRDKVAEQFMKDVISFYQAACTYLKAKVFPVGEPLWKHAQVADIKLKETALFSSLDYFMERFPCLLPHEVGEDESPQEALTRAKDQLQAEFTDYQSWEVPSHLMTEEKVATEQLWAQITKVKDCNEAMRFQVLPRVMLGILLLPSSPDPRKSHARLPGSPDPNIPEWDWGDDSGPTASNAETAATHTAASSTLRAPSSQHATGQDKGGQASDPASILGSEGEVSSIVERRGPEQDSVTAGSSPHISSLPININVSAANNLQMSSKSSLDEKRSRSLEDKNDCPTDSASFHRNYKTVHLPLLHNDIHSRRSLPCVFTMGFLPGAKALEGFSYVPQLHPLETLHNTLTFREMDDFLGRITSTRFPVPAISPTLAASRPSLMLISPSKYPHSYPPSSNSSSGPSSPSSAPTSVDFFLRMCMERSSDEPQCTDSESSLSSLARRRDNQVAGATTITKADDTAGKFLFGGVVVFQFSPQDVTVFGRGDSKKPQREDSLAEVLNSPSTTAKHTSMPEFFNTAATTTITTADTPQPSSGSETADCPTGLGCTPDPAAACPKDAHNLLCGEGCGPDRADSGHRQTDCDSTDAATSSDGKVKVAEQGPDQRSRAGNRFAVSRISDDAPHLSPRPPAKRKMTRQMLHNAASRLRTRLLAFQCFIGGRGGGSSPKSGY